jgi:gephyrin
VYNNPTVALMSTGDEIVDLHGQKATSNDNWGGIWDTNRPSLQAALEGMGYKVVDLGIVRDKLVFSFRTYPIVLNTFRDWTAR